MANTRVFKQQVKDAPHLTYRYTGIEEGDMGVDAVPMVVDVAAPREVINPDVKPDWVPNMGSTELFSQQPAHVSRLLLDGGEGALGGYAMDTMETARRDVANMHGGHVESGPRPRGWELDPESRESRGNVSNLKINYMENPVIDKTDTSLMELDPDVTEVTNASRKRHPLIEKLSAGAEASRGRLSQEQFFQPRLPGIY